MLNSTSIATRFRGALPDRETLARRWLSMKNTLKSMKEATEETALNVAGNGTTFGVFSLTYYIRERRRLAGKRNTFDKKGKFDATFWPGLAIMIFGSTPFAGKASRFVGGTGTALMCAGSTDFISKMAAEHHAKKK